jgi:hypothetical protein
MRAGARSSVPRRRTAPLRHSGATDRCPVAVTTRQPVVRWRSGYESLVASSARSGRSAQQQSAWPQRRTTTPRSTRHPHSAHSICTPSVLQAMTGRHSPVCGRRVRRLAGPERRLRFQPMAVADAARGPLRLHRRRCPGRSGHSNGARNVARQPVERSSPRRDQPRRTQQRARRLHSARRARTRLGGR